MRLINLGSGVLLALLMGPLAGMGSAQANIVYDFTGTCTSGTQCSVGEAVHGVLTLTDAYSPGTPVTNPVLVSWSWNSLSGSFSVPGDDVFSSVSGTLPNGTSSAVDLTLDFVGFATQFRTRTAPLDWIMNDSGAILGQGVDYQWALRDVSPVPLPAGIVLFLAALGLIGGVGCWKRGLLTGSA